MSISTANPERPITTGRLAVTAWDDLSEIELKHRPELDRYELRVANIRLPAGVTVHNTSAFKLMTSTWDPIDLPQAGERFVFTDLEAVKTKALELHKIGFHVSQRFFEILDQNIQSVNGKINDRT